VLLGKPQWNRTQVDWVNSAGSIDEVGSIHTIQGYDLNYADVIIGNDLRYDPVERRLYFDRNNYFDAKHGLGELVLCSQVRQRVCECLI
jgi:DUF2075 family protein